MQAASRPTAVRWLILAAITVLGGALRFNDLGDASLWWDELATWVEAQTGALGTHSAPANAVLTGLWFRLTGDTGTWAARALPALFGVLTIPVAFFIARHLRGDRAALLAAALVALSPLSIEYARQARPYGLFQLLAALLLLAWLGARRGEDLRRWAWYGAALAAACLTHLLTTQVVLAHGLAMAVLLAVAVREGAARGAVRRTLCFAVAAAGGVVLGLSWMLARQNVASALEGVYPDGIASFLRTWFVSLGPRIHYPGNAGASLVEVLALCFVGLFAAGLADLARRQKADAALAIGLTLLVPMAMLYATLGHKGAWWPWARYFVHVAVPFLVVVAIGADELVSRLPRGRGTLAVLALLPLALVPGLLASGQSRHLVAYWDEVSVDLATLHAANEIDGVVLYCGVGDPLYEDESGRLLAGHAAYRRGDAPVWFARGRELRSVDWIATVRPQRDFPAVGAPAALPPGRYAVAARFPIGWCGSAHLMPPFECAFLGERAAAVSLPAPLARYRSEPTMFLCDVPAARG